MLQVTVLFILCLQTIFFPSSALSTTTLKPESSDSRIINGTKAIRGQFAWQAALIITSNQGGGFCGGSLISAQWVLTAAHCTNKAVTVHVVLGIISLEDNTTSPILASKVIQHPNYDGTNLINDISLVLLSETVAFTSYIQPIKLGSTALADGSEVLVSGWGKTSQSSSVISTDLYWAQLTTISNVQCALTYGTFTLTGGIVCAKGTVAQSSCNGDSGGPIMTIEVSIPVLVGVVSFIPTQGCDIGIPSGYTRVAPYRSWIIANTGAL